MYQASGGKMPGAQPTQARKKPGQNFSGLSKNKFEI
jgi:hypothetical protein